MGDLTCDSERVRMEGHDTTFICEDDPVLLQEALPPARQTLCSCGEFHQRQDGTHDHCMNGDSVETEVDISGSSSSGVKRGEECDGTSQSHVVSEYSEPKESSSYESSPSFLPRLRLVYAMKGGQEDVREAAKHHLLKSGVSSGPQMYMIPRSPRSTIQ